MKTKLYFSFILVFALAFSVPKANAQVLIQYWDFNATPPSGGAGGDSLGNATNPLAANQVGPALTAGHITYSRPSKMFGSTGFADGILDNGSQGTGIYDYSNSNDTTSLATDNLFVRTRNPSDSCELLLYIPTTGYKNIKFDFALSASSTKGPNYGIFSYSTNGGISWVNPTAAMDTFNISGHTHPDTLQLQNPTTAGSAWYRVQMDFTSDASVNNNANFMVCIRIAGPNSNEQTSGNARFDNFAFWGTSTTGAGVNDLSTQGAGYSVYPNPAANSVNVISHYTGDKVITVYNIAGQAVSVIENHDIETTINTSSLNAGIYFVEIKEASTGNKYTVKLVKE
jgi:hypothetical protein